MSRAIGPDVSRWQGDVDWTRVHRAGAGFAIAKATEGLDFVDPAFTPARVKALQDAGLVYTAYHFARPQAGRSGGDEATHFVKVARYAGYGRAPHLELPLVLDIETTKLSPGQTRKFIERFVHVVVALTGRPPIIYTGPSFWQTHVAPGATRVNFGCPLWVAHYGVAKPTVPPAWRDWTFWQQTDHGTIAGIAGKCDMNVYNGTFRELRAQFFRDPLPRPPRPTPKKPKKRKPAPAGHYPEKLPAKYRALWDRPWEDRAARNKGFRRWLEAHGYLTPHFPKAEARCKDGRGIPDALNRRARDHAFNLEKFRHALGGRPLPIISWYRSPSYNRRIGGATKSKHMEAIATDHSREWVEAVGRSKVMAAANQIFRNGGLGVYPWGAVHVDTRGVRARWSSW